MFKNVKIENYKSLIDFEAEFDVSTENNNLVVIYGENGTGKTNFLTAIRDLSSLSHSLSAVNDTRNIYTKINDDDDAEFRQFMFSIVSQIQQASTVEGLFSKNLTYGQKKGKIYVKFAVNGRDAEYEIRFDESGLVYERLYYVIKENRGELYEILKQDGEIEVNLSPALFSQKKIENDILSKIEQFWGNYTLLGIIESVSSISNDRYIQENYNMNLLNVIDYFKSISTKNSPVEESGFSISKKTGPERYPLSRGTLPNNEASIKKLEIYEELVSEFLSSLFVEVIDVWYDQEIEKDGKTIEYELILQKNINSNIVEVPIYSESSGTKNLLELLSYLMLYLEGGIVLIDEVETAIHDLLVRDVVSGLVNTKFTGGQLITTTHNTMLMEQLDSRNLYILNNDESKKSLKSVKSYGAIKVRDAHNLRKRYLEGLYRGVPFTSGLDFEYMKDISEVKTDGKG